MKLSANSILQQGRYRIIGSFAETETYSLYDAYDNLLGNKIVVHESVISLPKVVSASDRAAISADFASRVKLLSSLRHDGIVRVRDGFSEADRQYLITEPVEVTFGAEACKAKPGETISRLLSAVHAISSMGNPGLIEIGPSRIRHTPDGNNRLLFFGFLPSFSRDSALSSYQPLECLWEGLDTATRKAISNGYDEDAMAVLESAPDIRSSIYAVGATAFSLLTGSDAPDALERSVEEIEGKGDPLAGALRKHSLPMELQPFLLESMELRREKRFQNAESAATSLPTNTAVPDAVAGRVDLAELVPQSTSENFTAIPVEENPASTALTETLAIDVDQANDTVETPVNNPAPAREFVFQAEHAGPPPSSSGKIIAIGVAAVAVIGLIVWAATTFMSGSDNASAATVINAAPAASEPVRTAEIQAISSEAAATTPTDSSSSSSPATMTTSTESLDPVAQKSRPTVADAKAAKREEIKPTPKPATAAKPKKSVTVDDLISDN